MARKSLGTIPAAGNSSNLLVPTSWITTALNLKLDKTGLLASTPLSYDSGTGVLSIQAASLTQDGYLSSANFNAFNNKENAISSGTTSQYWRGDKSWQDLPSAIRSTVLTGLVAGTNQAITATDSILAAFQNLQAQVNNKLGSTAQATDSDKLDGQHGSYYQTALGYTPLKNTTDTLTGDLTLSGGSLYLPATGFSGAGPIQSTVAVKFANATAAQEAYMLKLRLGGTWSILDSNDPGDGGIYASGSISAPSTTIGGRIHISDNDIEERGTNAESGLAFNYSGYNGGTTQFRNFDVYNGKNGLVLNITGSSKAATFSGSVSASSLAVPNTLIDSSGILISDGTSVFDRYARLTLTGSFTTGSRQYIGLMKAGTYAWGIGMNASGSLIFGKAKPGVDSQFEVNKLELTTSGDLSVPGKMYGTGLSTSWGSGSSGVGAFNAIMGTAPSGPTGATWLLMGTNGGVRRCGIQASDSDGTMLLFAGSAGNGYVTIDPSGGITALNAITATKVITKGNGTAGGIVLRNPSGVSYRLSINSSNQLQLDAI